MAWNSDLLSSCEEGVSDIDGVVEVDAEKVPAYIPVEEMPPNTPVEVATANESQAPVSRASVTLL